MIPYKEAILTLEKYIKIHGQHKFDLQKSKGNLSRERQCLTLECPQCTKLFNIEVSDCHERIITKKQTTIHCSRECSNFNKHAILNCKQCDKTFTKIKSEILKTKNHFCSRSCGATFNNKNKSYGIRRSKTEKFIEKMIKINYPDLQFYCNNKKQIGSELDFYFPNLNLALEFNGPLHYTAIYGEEKLKKIQANDMEKMTNCHKQSIKLITINTSKDYHIKEDTLNKRMLEIFNILDNEIIEQDLKHYR